MTPLLSKYLAGRPGLVLALVSCLALGWLAKTLDRSAERLPESKEVLAVLNAQDADLERRRHVLRYIISTKDRILARLVRGEWSLREAARSLQLLHEGEEGFVPEAFLQRAYPAASLEESYGQAVLANLRRSSVLPKEPEGSQILEGLEAERLRTWAPPP
jgi:hypothetical protein